MCRFQREFRISILFPFFRGDYVGWKDSIRHNLSSCHSFVKCSALGQVSEVGDSPAKSKIGGSWTFHQGGLGRVQRSGMKLFGVEYKRIAWWQYTGYLRTQTLGPFQKLFNSTDNQAIETVSFQVQENANFLHFCSRYVLLFHSELI